MSSDRAEAGIELHVNGSSHWLDVDTSKTLLQVLHDSLGLHGPKGACGVGVCGACTVLIEGQPFCSCLLLPQQVEGKEIQTVEGLAVDGALHPVQQAFIDHAAFQCAYCTPGFILSTVALLKHNPRPDDEAIREYLAGNLCRCGSYVHIMQAVRASAQEGQSGKAE